MRGIDVSHHQGGIDWPKVAANGYRFAVVKLTEGLGYRDPNAAHNVSSARAAGLIVGGYHYAQPAKNDPHSEADYFLRHMPGMTPQFFVLDLEEQARGANVGRWAMQWLELVERTTGETPFIYTGLDYALKNLAREGGLSKYPLWLAAYRRIPPPAPAPWKRWSIWQFTSSGKVAGVHGNCDVNITSNDLVFDRYTGKDDEVNQADKDEIVNRVTAEVLGALGPQLDTGDDEHSKPRGPIGGVVAVLEHKTEVQGLDLGWLKDSVQRLATAQSVDLLPPPGSHA